MAVGGRPNLAAILAAARRAGKVAGITRLAELTCLDRIGMPVWQAVRPLSRALSVHQGKGLSDGAAQIGALLEGLESHLAEQFDGDGPVCAWEELPPHARPSDIADVAHDRGWPPDPRTPVRWAEARMFDGGKPLCLPFDLVSLDFTRGLETPFDRSSNGVATQLSHEAALLRAVCELIERDAVTEWRARGPFACTRDRIALTSIPLGWFGNLAERLRAAGAWIACYCVPSIGNVPVFVCEAADYGKEGALYRTAWGSGCDPDPETALLRAVTEAIQARATFIAGAREDFPPSAYGRGSGPAIAFGFPVPPGWASVVWDDIAPGPSDIEDIAEAIAAAGYPALAHIELGRVEGFVTVRAFVPGLAGLHRRRRAPS